MAGAPDRAAAIWLASPLGALVGPAKTAALELASLVELPPGRAIAVEGQPVRAVVLLGSGRVRVERARQSDAAQAAALPLGHRGPGDVIGLGAFAGTHATATATVVDPGDGLALPMAGLRKVAAAEPRLRTALQAAAAAALASTQRRLETLLLQGVEGRLARLLLEATTRWGVPHARGTLITAPYTHAELALLIGSTRETVTLLFGKLRREGVVEVERRRLLVRDRDKLAEHAAVDD